MRAQLAPLSTLDQSAMSIIDRCLKYSSSYIESKDVQLFLVRSGQTAMKLLFEAVDIVFTPKQIAKQLLLIFALQSTVLVSRALMSSLKNLTLLFSQKEKSLRQLRKDIHAANNYSEWVKLANKIDSLTGADKWRENETSSLYDHRVLRRRIQDICALVAERNIFSLIFRLRGGLARDQFGMQHSGLFSKAVGGTKDIVEEYHNTVCLALDMVCDTDDSEVPTDAKLAFFNETRHAYGRTALLVCIVEILPYRSWS